MTKILLRKIRKNKILSQLSDAAWFTYEDYDINVVEQANIPKFSELDDIGTAHRLYELFFDDVLVDMIVDYTKWYGYREKADTSVEITNETFHLFFGMLLLIGCRNLPNCKIY